MSSYDPMSVNSEFSQLGRRREQKGRYQRRTALHEKHAAVDPALSEEGNGNVRELHAAKFKLLTLHMTKDSDLIGNLTQQCATAIMSS